MNCFMDMSIGSDLQSFIKVHQKCKNQLQKIILNHFKQFIPYQVHALDIQALTPEQSSKTSENVFHPHGGGQGIHSKAIERRKQKENGD